MPAGFQLFRDNGGTLVSLDSEKMAARLVSIGSVNISNTGVAATVSIPGPLIGSAITILLRPQSGMTVGAFVQLASSFTFHGTPGNCEWAIISHMGNPIVHSSGSGLELYNSQGVMTFSSNHRHPRIFQIVSSTVPAWGTGGGYYGFNVSIGPFPSRPWMIATELIYGYETTNGSNDDYTFPQHAYGAAINAASTILTIEARGGDSFQFDYGFVASKSPYRNKPLKVPLCILPGY